MKKFKVIASLLLACTIIIASFVSIAASVNILYGDVNGDGVINSKDSKRLREYNASWDVEINEANSDVNGDGVINSKDSLLLRRYIADWPVTFPTIPTEPDLEIPGDYITKLNEKVAVDQIGYGINAAKGAKIRELMEDTPSSVSEKQCFVVNADTNEVVFAGTSEKRKFDSNTNGYVTDFDFSDVKTPGKYYVQTPIGKSYTFEISKNPYKEVHEAMITALYYNRCGVAVDKSIVGEHYAYDACHIGPAKIIGYDGEVLGTIEDTSGGLHDAGDYGRYVTPANQVVADLLYANELFPNATSLDLFDDEIKGLPDVLDQARHEAEWLLKMQDPVSGGVYWRLVTKEFAGWYDMPDKDSIFNTHGLFASRIMLKSTAGFVGSAAASYRVFKTIDPEFANKALNAAKKAYDYVLEHMNDPEAHKKFSSKLHENNYLTAGDYGSDNAWGDIWWAATELFRATGEEKYDNDVKSLVQRKNDGDINFNYTGITAYDIGGAGSLAYLLADGADDAIKQEILAAHVKSSEQAKVQYIKDKYNVVISSYYWGSNASIAATLKTLAITDYFNGTNNYEQIIRDNMSYIFGKNALSQSYVTGYGSKSPQNPHHRPSMTATYRHGVGPAPGWMVGGPVNSGTNYQDVNDKYDNNEVCIYWNTSPVFALASVIESDLK